MTEQDQYRTRLKKWLPWVGAAVVIIAAYFINVEVQTHLGKKVLAQTGLQSVPLQEALNRAQTQGKQVLVDVSAIWCPTCRRLDKEVFSNEQVQAALHENYVFSRIEYESDDGEAFMKKYNVSGFPTLVVLDAQGNKIDHIKLTFDPQDFIARL